MEIYISIDDTDSLEKGSTGVLAEYIRELMEDYGWGKSSFVTRHQLYLHPDIPFTSHNSSMCFILYSKEDRYQDIIELCRDILRNKSEAEADPGLCVAKKDQIKNLSEVIQFGKRAKKEVLTKKEAYSLAQTLGIHLSEHGGTGDGIIGALAGLGLRLSNTDGRIRGREHIPNIGGYTSIGEILSNTDISEVMAFGGEKLPLNTKVKIGDEVKALYLYGQKGLLLKPFFDVDLGENIYRTLLKEEWKKIKN